LTPNPSPGPIDPILDVLTGAELFSGLGDDDLRRLTECSRRRRFDDGDVLVRPGEPTANSWVVGEGSLRIEGGDASRDVGPGGVVMALALAETLPSTVTVTAVEPTEVVELSGPDLRRELPTDSLAARIVAIASRGGARRSDVDPSAGAKSAAVSRELQRSMVPVEAPQLDGHDLAVGTTAEDHGQGATVWDALTLPSGRRVLAVLQVESGGTLPALELAMARAALRAGSTARDDLPGLLEGSNLALASRRGDAGSGSVACGLLALDADGTEWAAAGRVPAGVIGRVGTFVELGSHGPPLGMLDGFRYGSEVVELGVGDALLALSAGSVGLLRGAADLVVQVQDKPAGEVVSIVHRALRRAHHGPAPETSVLFLRKH